MKPSSLQNRHVQGAVGFSVLLLFLLLFFTTVILQDSLLLTLQAKILLPLSFLIEDFLSLDLVYFGISIKQKIHVCFAFKNSVVFMLVIFYFSSLAWDGLES